MHNLAESAERNAKRTATKKLSNLYGGSIVLPEEKNGFVNLSSVTLTEDQVELLNLGLNCHLQPKFRSIEKQAQLEILYQDIMKLQETEKSR